MRWLESNYDYVQLLNIKNNLSLIKQATQFFDEKRLFQNNIPDGDRFSPFNEYGDVTDETPVISRPAGRFEEVRLSYITDAGMAAYNASYAQLTAKGVKVYFGFAPRYFKDAAYDENSAADFSVNAELSAHIALFEETLADALDIPVISTVEKNALPQKYFFDALNTHILPDGKQLHTTVFIESLKARLSYENKNG